MFTTLFETESQHLSALEGDSMIIRQYGRYSSALLLGYTYK